MKDRRGVKRDGFDQTQIERLFSSVGVQQIKVEVKVIQNITKLILN